MSIHRSMGSSPVGVQCAFDYRSLLVSMCLYLAPFFAIRISLRCTSPLYPYFCAVFLSFLPSPPLRISPPSPVCYLPFYRSGMLILVLVLVFKDSLRTFLKSLSLSWSLGVRYLSLSLSLGGQVQEVLVLVLVLVV